MSGLGGPDSLRKKVTIQMTPTHTDNAVTPLEGGGVFDTAQFGQWHARPAQEICAELGSSTQGLKTTEALARLGRFGPNEMGADRPPSPWRMLLQQFTSPLIYVLLAAMGVSLAMRAWGDALVIGIVLAVNAAVGFFQQFKAENSMRALKRLVSPQASVRRDGRVQLIDARGLVPGDIVQIDEGNIVPADVRLLRVDSVRVNEAMLTGESVPVTKQEAALPTPDLPVADQRNMAFLGTAVAGGQGEGVVVGTGMQTAVGRIAQSLRQTVTPRTPLQLRIDRLAKVLAVVVLVAAAVSFAIGILRGYSTGEMFLVALALAVSAMPEGLPVVVTVALAVGMRRMAKRHAVIRRLPAVETLGSTSVIISDKTGTLTQNLMSVEALRPTPGVTERDLLTAAVATNAARLGSDSGDDRGDPMELALLRAGRSLGLEHQAFESCLLHNVPFQTERRFSAATCRDAEGKAVTHVKGAPEVVATMCRNVDEAEVARNLHEMAGEGLRVLAAASGQASDHWDTPTGLRFLGLIGLMDPPRPEAAQAVADCHAAGIRVVMCTGDHAATAAAIARQLGLVPAGTEPRVMTGQQLVAIGQSELAAVVREFDVFARVAPEQKLRIVNALREVGDVVAVTGDGVNDAPALKAADIGCAMGRSGSDVAREASEMVLTDDNFATIYAAVREGRAAFRNIRMATFFLLSTGIAEVIGFITSLVLGWPLPMLPVQILWLNVVTNGLEDVSLAFEPPDDELTKSPPRPRREGVVGRVLWHRMLWVALLMASAMLAVFWWQWQIARVSIDEARSAALTTLVLIQVAHVFNCRSESTSILALPLRRNPFVPIGALASFLVHVAAMHLPWTQALLGLRPLGWDVWVVMSVFALLNVLLNELLKRLQRGGVSPR